MKTPIVEFLQAARGAGMRISAAESLDAFRALDAVGYEDRALFKDALGIVLAKTTEEKELFDACFELYFQRTDRSEQPAGDDAAPDDAGDDEVSLVALLLRGDRAGLAAALERAARSAGAPRIRFFTQTGYFTNRIFEALGGAGVAAEIARLRAQGEAAGDDTAAALERARDALRENIRELVERYLALAQRGDDARWRDAYLGAARLGTLGRRDLDRMRVVVRALAKQLATRYGRTRRRKRRGQLDVRRTLRRNMAFGGVPFHTVWKRRKVDKPRIMVLCDVSGSVAPLAQFLLLFLYSLAEAVSDIRSFAFSNRLIEVSEIVERESLDDAIATIMREVGFGSSDYGRSLTDFAGGWLDDVDKKTSIVILGDGRTNYDEPRVDIMRTLYERSRRVVWLNPEGVASWGTGDSAMDRYRPYCSRAIVCASVRDLQRAVEDLLRHDR